MNRRRFLLTPLAGAFAAPIAAEAQQTGKVARIGLLTPSSPAGSGHLVEAFRQGLRELGYVEGKTVVVEARYGDGRTDTTAGARTGARRP